MNTEIPKTSETGGAQSLPVSPYKAGLSCRCPKCGQGALYRNGLELQEKCEACGFDLSWADTGDGAQVFVILILGALCAIAGFILYGAGLPIWAIMAILMLVIAGGSYFMLRIFKATLLALQFHHDAREGSLTGEGPKSE